MKYNCEQLEKDIKKILRINELTEEETFAIKEIFIELIEENQEYQDIREAIKYKEIILRKCKETDVLKKYI